MGFSLLVNQDHIPVSNRAGFLTWPFMSRRAALNVQFPEIDIAAHELKGQIKNPALLLTGIWS